MTNQAANCGNITSGLGANSFPARQVNQHFVALNTATHKIAARHARWSPGAGDWPFSNDVARAVLQPSSAERCMGRIGVSKAFDRVRFESGAAATHKELTPSGTLPSVPPGGTWGQFELHRLAPFYSEAA